MQILKKNKYKKFGISKIQTKAFRKDLKSKVETLKFNGVSITISNPFWFLHSIDELFIDQVYKFKSQTNEPVIIDCGASWGLSILYFKQLYPKSKVWAFEADPFIFDLLEKNISNANLNDVVLMNEAVWKKNEKIFFSSDQALGGTISELGINNIEKPFEVTAIRFRDFLNSIAQIDFLKIDIDGAEYEVIKDCKDCLNNIKYLFIEYHSIPDNPQRLHEILSIVSAAGFRYYLKEAWNNMQYPFAHEKAPYYDLQLNVFCYRT